VQMFQKITLATSGWVCVCLLVATADGQDRTLPEPPQANSPVTLVAASDRVTGKSEKRDFFRYLASVNHFCISVWLKKIVKYKKEKCR